MHISCRKKCNPRTHKILLENAKGSKTDRKIHQRIIWTCRKQWFPSKNDRIRDRLVIWLRSKDLTEKKIQLREDHSLEKAIEIAHSYEQVKHQIEETQEKSVDTIAENKRQTAKQPR